MKNILPFLLIIFCSSFCLEGDIFFELKKKTDEFFSKNKRAKLELFFNQPKYTAGDTVRFRIAYLNASDLKAVSGKQIVHLCWFDQNGNTVLTEWASVVDG